MIRSASMHVGEFVSPRTPKRTAGCGLRKKFAKEETKEAALRETEVVTITHGTRITQQPRGEARAMVEGAPQRTHHQLKPGLPDLLPEAPPPPAEQSAGRGQGKGKGRKGMFCNQCNRAGRPAEHDYKFCEYFKKWINDGCPGAPGSTAPHDDIGATAGTTGAVSSSSAVAQ